jgi:subfamily B ATP-binding cassette protein MsbA
MRELGRLLAYVKPYLGSMLLASLLMGIGGALMAAVVSTAKPLVDGVLLGTDGGSLRPFPWVHVELGERVYLWAPAVVVLLFLVRGAALYAGQYLTVRNGAMVIRDLRIALYESLMCQSLGFFRRHPTGTILSRVLSDVQRLQEMVTTQLADFVRVACMIPFLLLVALWHDWRSSLVVLIVLPLLGWPMVRLGRRLRRAASASQEEMAEVANRLSESVTGIEVVKSFAMERYETGRFRSAVGRMLLADLRAGHAQALAPAVMELLGAVIGAMLFAAAGHAIGRGALDAGNFTVVLFSLGLLFMSIRRLNRVYAETQRALASATRVFAMIDAPPEVSDRPGARELSGFADRVVLRGVGFSYDTTRVLDGIDLEIERGTTVALVGASGSGKTTLVRLLLRFYEPQEGSIRIDGVELGDLELDSLRAQIGLVTQDSVLFADSVRNNIAYGREDIPLARIVEAARASQAHDFIERLPLGYDTPLGERGATLSSGQRQRIAIARALVKDPPLLVLDEATSALDAESEAAVRTALERLMEGRTSLIVAHRLATVRSAQRIVVLDRGRIVERGDHSALLARGGVYARLFRLQLEDRHA